MKNEDLKYKSPSDDGLVSWEDLVSTLENEGEGEWQIPEYQPDYPTLGMENWAESVLDILQGWVVDPDELRGPHYSTCLRKSGLPVIQKALAELERHHVDFAEWQPTTWQPTGRTFTLLRERDKLWLVLVDSGGVPKHMPADFWRPGIPEPLQIF